MANLKTKYWIESGDIKTRMPAQHNTGMFRSLDDIIRDVLKCCGIDCCDPEQNGGRPAIEATNGLTYDEGEVKLGGALSENTNIDVATYSITFEKNDLELTNSKKTFLNFTNRDFAGEYLVNPTYGQGFEARFFNGIVIVLEGQDFITIPIFGKEITDGVTSLRYIISITDSEIDLHAEDDTLAASVMVRPGGVILDWNGNYTVDVNDQGFVVTHSGKISLKANATDIISENYNNTRDDSESEQPINFLYTTDQGVFQSAPIAGMLDNALVSLGSVSADKTLTASEVNILCDNGAANIILTLPDASTCPNHIYYIHRNAGSTGEIELVPTSGQIQKLSGILSSSTTLEALGSYGQHIQIQAIGGNWLRLN